MGGARPSRDARGGGGGRPTRLRSRFVRPPSRRRRILLGVPVPVAADSVRRVTGRAEAYRSTRRVATSTTRSAREGCFSFPTGSIFFKYAFPLFDGRFVDHSGRAARRRDPRTTRARRRSVPRRRLRRGVPLARPGLVPEGRRPRRVRRGFLGLGLYVKSYSTPRRYDASRRPRKTGSREGTKPKRRGLNGPFSHYGPFSDGP